MSYNLNKLVKLSALQELVQKIKTLFATKEEVQNLKTLPDYDNVECEFLKVNEEKQLEWSNFLEYLKVNTIKIACNDLSKEPPYPQISIILEPNGTISQPILQAESGAGIYPIIRDIASPIQPRDVANKQYVDENTPLVITFSGTTARENASCDTSWEVIQENINKNRPIKARYKDSSNNYFDLLLTQSSSSISGSCIHYTYIQDPSQGYIYCQVIYDANELYIEYDEI